ncbi:threonine-phosphate decarboxylase [Tropicimonas sp. TH_r6]|uniref:threonine-phosphate decarboxylase n=1 Tax=Tropicimonas sp. TH_r6 TaxID=3082085 RepID=UPI00295343F2|nr:threonine-phosphate decarboxylase [Tropicimonas sp. TH_r6]MDV7143311.1 threonine-phosphate decarboxylase [Tropicimonas sp. TH_r6]
MTTGSGETGGRDHGGGLDAARSRWGGDRSDWLDLSTGINPVPYPRPPLSAEAWTALPDAGAQARLVKAARQFWSVPDGLEILATPGASAPIARLPALLGSAPTGQVHIPQPTYNEHAAAFRAAGWQVTTEPKDAQTATVCVHPNNPDGRLWQAGELPAEGFLVLDESFCDIAPEASLIRHVTTRNQTILLKSFGKFWGLAGLRLGFAIGAPALITPLREMIGPWAVSGPALEIGAAALEDREWAEDSRVRLARDGARLDALIADAGGELEGGTPLFRLYRVGSATEMQARLARGRVWSRVFPYSDTWLRLGLPGSENNWQQLTEALS